MIEISTYKCSYCGKIFEDPDECIEHEDKEFFNLVRAEGSLRCWDIAGTSIPLDENFDTERVFYVMATSEDARTLFDELQDRAGCKKCFVYENAESNTLMYYGTDDLWHNWSTEMDKLLAIRNSLEGISR